MGVFKSKAVVSAIAADAFYMRTHNKQMIQELMGQVVACCMEEAQYALLDKIIKQGL